MNPWLGIALTLGLLLATMAGLHAYKRIRPTGAELSRKLMHVSLGAITLSFPWLFGEPWPVVVVCLAIVAGLVLLRISLVLKARLGGVIDSVERRSLGEIYFPISVATLFVLSGGDPILYGVPLLVLTLADLAAALVGTVYGHWRYSTVEGGRKSAEGSIAFLMVAFFVIHVPILLFTETERAQTLLIALILGLLVTLFEAIAWRGLDNLFIPLAGFFLFRELLRMGAPDLLFHLGVLLALALIALLRRARTTLDDSALLSAVLAGYVIWVLGGWQWIVLPLILFIRGVPLPSAIGRGEPHFHRLHAVLGVAGPGLVWLVIAEALDRPDLFYPFAISFAVHLAVFELARPRSSLAGRSPLLASTLCGVKSWLFLFVPFVLLESLAPRALSQAIWALPIVTLAAVGFGWTQRRLDALPNDAARWAGQAAWSIAGSVIGLLWFSMT
jgi:phytol kinase